MLGGAARVLADDTEAGVGSEWSALNPQINGKPAAVRIQMDSCKVRARYDQTTMIIPGAAET